MITGPGFTRRRLFFFALEDLGRMLRGEADVAPLAVDAQVLQAYIDHPRRALGLEIVSESFGEVVPGGQSPTGWVGTWPKTPEEPPR